MSLYAPSKSPFFDLRSPLTWATIGLFGIVFTLEMLTPPEYVMGYLYISPILFANPRHRRTTFGLTCTAVCLTLINLWIPGDRPIHIATLANRFITALALVATGILSDRNRSIQQTLAQQQAKLQTQEKLASLREDFTSTLAHDLKTPLLGSIETLKAFQNEQFGNVQPKQKVVLDMMIRSHQTSLQLVETLLDVYRNDAEGLYLDRSTIDLAKLAEDVSIALLNLATSRQILISLHYGDSDFRKFLWVNGDAFQLQRVFTNLLTNAINHSPRGAKVEVVLETQSSSHLVKVVDAGAGIRPEEMPHLFERFYQGHSDRQASGSGLGLYLARQIIEAHDGTIWAENHAPHGAVFGFRLPALIHSLPAR